MSFAIVVPHIVKYEKKNPARVKITQVEVQQKTEGYPDCCPECSMYYYLLCEQLTCMHAVREVHGLQRHSASS